MKVILLKDCKDGKENQIIEVSNGYGTNFLIRKGLALPYNKKTSYVLKQKLINLENTKKINHQKLTNLKNLIEKIELLFSLKKTGDVIHGSITKKQIHQKLKENHVNLESHQIENIKITTLGISSINIFLNKEIVAKLKIKVLEDVR